MRFMRPILQEDERLVRVTLVTGSYQLAAGGGLLEL
jgi:hypothetical protein